MSNPSLNEEQKAHLRELDELAPSQRCWCGWYALGECPHCPKHKTAQDKLNSRSAERAGFEPAGDKSPRA